MRAIEKEPFEQAYNQMMEREIKASRGERKSRLQKDHGFLEKLFLEKVWWPAVGSLEYVHPEYEIRDFKDGSRFCDFAYLPPKGSKILLEADGFGPHLRDASRWKFGDDLERQNHILIDGWKLLRFSKDYIVEKPKQCQQTLLLGLSKWTGTGAKESIALNVYERAILHLAAEYPNELTPAFIADILQINRRTATANLRSLEEKGFFVSIRSVKGRRMRYAPLASARNLGR